MKTFIAICCIALASCAKTKEWMTMDLKAQYKITFGSEPVPKIPQVDDKSGK